MFVRLQCPACGKSLLVECDATPQVLVCRACGTSFEPPPDCMLPAAYEADWTAPASRARGGRSRYVLSIGLVTGITLLMIGGLLAAIWPRRPGAPAQAAGAPAAPLIQPIATATSAGPSLTDRVLAMKTDAEVLALSGNFNGAAEKYRQIRALLGGRDASGPLLKELARQVDEGERRLNAVLAAQRPANASADFASGQPAVTSASDFSSQSPAADAGPGDSVPQPQPAANVAPPPTSTGASDFGQPPAIRADRPNRLVPAAARAQLRGIGDAEIGRAIERGASFLLSQMKDGELPPDGAIVDSQRQALDALCVYALAQSGLAINDARLSPHGTLLPRMLERLRGYDLKSDGQVTNRPITYGRSLRAAALATYNRQEDRNVLKQDVAWLIRSQVQGAYTYDDLYLHLMEQGMKPTEGRGPVDQGVVVPPNQLDCGDGSDFGGGSPPPGFSPGDGPYVGGGGSPPPPPPSIPGGPGFGPSGPGSQPPAKPSWYNPPPRYQSPPILRYVPPQFDRGYMGTHLNPPAPKGPSGPGGPPGRSGPYVPPGWNDGFKPNAPGPTFVFPWDNSNSQYGLLGVWAGAEVGMEVPDAYWRDVEHHWIACQLGTGEWAYHAGNKKGYYAMTCAGVASLLVTHDYLDIPQLKGAIGREPYSPSLAAGLAWLDAGNHGVDVPNAGTHYVGYDLFGIERVGLASGFKYFGSHDWYRELAGRIVPAQFADGAFGHEDHGNDAIVDTAYTLLFLSRGRHPVMMTKLKFGKYWDNRPRDLANLAKFAGRELERPLNWQVVGIEHDWQDYFDSPVLYIASHEAPQLQDADYRKLRSFVLAGGLIFTQADGASPAFNAWVPELARRIAPGYKLEPLPDNSPVYSIEYKVAAHPPMLGVSNGSRLLLVHSPVDLSLAWQERSTKTRRWAFEIGTNIFVYASGKPDLRNRLDSPYVPAPPDAPKATLRVAVLQYNGNWNPEPAAWFRMSRCLQWEGGPALDVRPLAITDLGPGVCPVAALTGTDAHKFSPAEVQALRAYVVSGGTLLIDATGGENAFARSVRDALLPAAFSDGVDEPLRPDHPLVKGMKPGLANASPVRLRQFAIDRLGKLAPQIRVLDVGKGHVVFSALDLTSGLLGTRTWGVLGYEPVSAQAFVRNVLLWNPNP
jgi:hypothetical protein